MSENYQLPLPVGLFIVLIKPTQLTAHMWGTAAEEVTNDSHL